MYAQQMIEEYLYPESDTWRPERFVPIRSRREFFPSAAFISDEPAAPSQRQLELSLTTVATVVQQSTAKATRERTLPEPDAAPSVTAVPWRDSVIRTPRAAFQPMQRRKQKQSPFTPGGFLFGCALGSAAAAVVLLVLQFAVG
jgi:hypothetical protein